MLNGWHEGERTGSGTVVWKARERHAAGDIDYQQFIDIVGSSAPSVGHCNTMGTASTMNALAEALGMTLPGSAAIPAPYRERGQSAYDTGRRIVEMVWEDLKPSDIMTREAFENVIVANAAIGGSTNAPIHINADRQAYRRAARPTTTGNGSASTSRSSSTCSRPGDYLGEEYFRAGGLPAVIAELIEAGKIHEDALTVQRARRWVRIAAASTPGIATVIRPTSGRSGARRASSISRAPCSISAIMKTSVISKEFHDRYLSNPEDPNAFEGTGRGVRGARRTIMTASTIRRSASTSTRS